MALLEVNYHAHSLGMDMQMNVVLPDEAPPPWRTLYLLHGMGNDYTAWIRKSNVERYAKDFGLALVMPCTHLGWYTDMRMGPRYFEHVAHEIPALCRAFFPNLSHRREDTFAAGLSMGGYGALKCALRAPETFSRAISLSGALDVAEICRLRQVEADAPYWRDVFGPADQVPGSFDDLLAAATEMRDSPLRPAVWIWCGTEDFLYPLNVRMRDHLQSLHYDLVYSESPGDHQWRYWDEQIQRALRWLPLEGGGS